MTESPQIERTHSGVKRARVELEHAELTLRVPALVATNYATKPMHWRGEVLETAKFNERNAHILILPRDPRVDNYRAELAAAYNDRFSESFSSHGYRLDASTRKARLRLARRELKEACEILDNRVNYRGMKVAWKDGGRSVGLASILEAGAEVAFWRKVIRECEYFDKIKQENKWAVARSRVKPI